MSRQQKLIIILLAVGDAVACLLLGTAIAYTVWVQPDLQAVEPLPPVASTRPPRPALPPTWTPRPTSAPYVAPTPTPRPPTEEEAALLDQVEERGEDALCVTWGGEHVTVVLGPGEAVVEEVLAVVSSPE